MNPTGPSGPGEDELRRMLADRAEQAPSGDEIARRALTAIGTSAPERTRHRWYVPAAAAAAIAALVSGLVVFGAHRHQSNGAGQPAPDRPASQATAGERTAQQQTPGDRGVPATSFRATDVSIGAGFGYALGTAACGTSTCGYLRVLGPLQRWTLRAQLSMPVAAGIGGACTRTGCVDQVRFATAEIGYLYGPDAFYGTVDGGRSWQQQAGGALALVATAAAVVRVSAAGAALRVTAATPGSAAWTPSDVPGLVPGGLLLAAGQHSFVLLGRTTAGPSPLYSSSDARSWSAVATPCPSGSTATGLAAGGELLTVVCASTGNPAVDVRRYRVAAGRPALVAHRSVSVGSAAPALAMSSAGTAVVSGATALRVDAAGTWTPVNGLAATAGPAVLGFGIGSSAFYVGADGTQPWVSGDDGRSWRRGSFS